MTDPCALTLDMRVSRCFAHVCSKGETPAVKRHVRIAVARGTLASPDAPLAPRRRMQQDVVAGAEECLAVAAAGFFDDHDLWKVLMVSRPTYEIGLQLVEAQLNIQAI